MGMSLSKLQELMVDSKAWHAVVHGVTRSRTWLSDWTDWIILKGQIISVPSQWRWMLIDEYHQDFPVLDIIKAVELGES